MIGASKTIFSGNMDVTDRGYGYGGDPRHVLYMLLLHMGIRFAVKFENIEKYFMPLPMDIPIVGIPYFILEKNIKSTPQIDSTDKDMILWIDPISSVPKEIFLSERDKFTLEFGIFVFPIGKKGHAICGFKCDSYYKIYDSSSNIMFTCDWWDYKNPKIIHQMTDILKETYRYISTIKLVCCAYVNISDSNVKKYILEGSC